MELIGESPLSPSTSPLSFIDSEFEEVAMSSRGSPELSDGRLSSYGQPVAAILPTPRIPRQRPDEMVRPIPTYHLNFLQESSYFQPVDSTNAKIQGIANHRSRKCTITNCVHSNRATIPSHRRHHTNGDTFTAQVYGRCLRQFYWSISTICPIWIPVQHSAQFL